MLSRQGQLGLQHQGGGKAGGEEVLVEAKVGRVDRRGRRGFSLLLLDQGAHVEGSDGLELV